MAGTILKKPIGAWIILEKTNLRLLKNIIKNQDRVGSGKPCQAVPGASIILAGYKI
jgi:hypothetical protein